MDQKTTLFDLPHEILTVLLLSLPIESKLNLTRVHSGLRKLLTQGLFWRIIHLPRHTPTLSTLMGTLYTYILPKVGPHLFSFKSNTNFDSIHLTFISKLSTHLLDLDLTGSNVSESGLTYLLTLGPRTLQRLKLGNVKEVSDKVLKLVGGRCPDLRVLNVSSFTTGCRYH